MRKMKLKIMKSAAAHYVMRARDKVRLNLKRTPPKNYDGWFEKIQTDLLIVKWMLGVLIVVVVLSML